MGYSRRSLLARAGLTTVGTALAVAGLPAPHPRQPPERPVEPHDGAVPEIADETESPYARYHYSREDDGFEARGPVNVVVALAGTERTLADVMDVFWAAKWVEQPAGYIRFAYDVHHDRYSRPHVTAAQTFFGGFGRHHLRAWDFQGAVSFQAHQDTPARPGHEFASHESTQHLIEWMFHEAGWTVKPDGVYFANETAPDHDGYVTVIEP